MERYQAEREPLMGYVRHGSSINNPGGLLDSSGDSDRTPTASVTYSSVQLEPQKLYARRWYCLLLYVLLCFIIGLVQSALSSIEHALQVSFGWSDAEISLVNSLPALMFLLSIVFCTWVLDTKGLRMAALIGAFALALGSGIRCITSTPSWCTWTFNAGQLLIGLTSSFTYGAPTTFSNTWFPPHQRTTATSVPGIGNALGLGIGSVLAPLLVRVRHKKPHNTSLLSYQATPVPFSNTTDVPTYIAEMRDSIMFLMYIQFGLSLAIFIAILVYFPAKPPTPPSVSACADRVDFRRGLVAIFRRGRFWLLAMTYTVSNGPLSGFGGLLDVDLDAAKVPGDQMVTGYMSLGALVAAIFSCLAISTFADRFRQYIKHLLLLCFVAATGAFLWFALIIQGVAPANYASLYASFIIGSLMTMGCVPVLMELACDSAYPISEGLTTGVMNATSNIASLIFFGALMVPGIGTQWMNWAMAACIAVCIPLLIPFSPSAGRMQIDAKPTLHDSEKSSSYGSAS